MTKGLEGLHPNVPSFAGMHQDRGDRAEDDRDVKIQYAIATKCDLGRAVPKARVVMKREFKTGGRTMKGLRCTIAWTMAAGLLMATAGPGVAEKDLRRLRI